jgi:hypothetical protein
VTVVVAAIGRYAVVLNARFRSVAMFAPKLIRIIYVCNCSNRIINIASVSIKLISIVTFLLTLFIGKLLII